MSEQATVDEIRELLRDTDAILKRLAQDSDRRAKEDDRRAAEADRRAVEADRRAAEADRRAAEADRRGEELDQRYAKAEAENDALRLRIEALRQSQAETKVFLDAVGRRVDDLTGKWGKFVEGVIAPAAGRLFQERGIPVHGVYQRAKQRRNGHQIEVDILVKNQRHVVAIEVKSTLKVEDVREHLDRLGEFKTFYPEFADHRLYGAVAGIVIEENADKFAYRQGLFVIGQSGDTAMILNDPAFQPKAW